MRVRRSWFPALLAGVALFTACGGDADLRTGEVAPVPRRTVVWLTDEGIDGETAARLAEVGVDELVVWRGSILLSSSAPVVQLREGPPVEGPIPTAVALEVKGLTSGVQEKAADAVWAALAADFGDQLPAELILDLPNVGEGAADFISRLARESGLAVMPMLAVNQVESPAGRAVAKAAHGCVVPVFGTQGGDLRGMDVRAVQPLAVKLAAIADLGVRVRVAIALRPRVEPPVNGWAQDVDPLTDEKNSEIKRTSALDRSFAVKRTFDWAGRSWGPGQTIAISWVDTARLGSFLLDSHRLILPEVVGWDLVTLPPVGSNLGLGREELIRFLAGEGPGPVIEVKARRNGRSVTVEMTNSSVFRSAITTFGNWVQVELESGSLVVSSRGTFDRVVLGNIVDGEWRPNPTGRPDAVRFVETHIAPGEALSTEAIRLPSSRSRFVVRWHVQLSDGSVVEGVLD